MGTLDRYQAILLDMNGTFMFGHDRFGPAQDYHATYRAWGGVRLSADELRRAIDDCYDRLAVLYDDPLRADCFPAVRDVLAELPAGEAELVESVIARHELGGISAEYAAALQQLAATHRLAVVTNIWSRKEPWLDELRRAGVLEFFTAAVFSSDGPYIKPSPVLFLQALAAVGVPASAAVVVGDSLRCDIAGALAAGLDSIWINPNGTARPADSPVPTFEVRSLLELIAPNAPHSRDGR